MNIGSNLKLSSNLHYSNLGHPLNTDLRRVLSTNFEDDDSWNILWHNIREVLWSNLNDNLETKLHNNLRNK